jgi:hypothetical protein
MPSSLGCSCPDAPDQGGLAIPVAVRTHKQSLEVVERGVLNNLLSERRHWPVAELEENIGREHFEEAIVSLKDVGLLQREGDAIFATAAAIRGDELAL